jgi:acetyl CoA:N6-hydroxylysine acetyl transferase
MNKLLYSATPLFLKPLHYPGELLFSKKDLGLSRTLSFRSFNLDTDVDMVHRWVNLDYSRKYWQLNGDRKRVVDLYYSIQRNSNGHSYIGLLDDMPVCQFDVYRVLADEIRQYVTADEHDCGFHLLMAPNEKPVPGLSKAVCEAFLDYYFSFDESKRMFAEPDINNKRSNALLQKLGFEFSQAIQMSYKTANLYSLSKTKFHATHPLY